MKYRWKLLILLLCISIIPVISLRIFGTHNVHLMAEALIDQIRLKQENEVAGKLHILIQDYSRTIETIREKVEMAVFFQTFGITRILPDTTLRQQAKTDITTLQMMAPIYQAVAQYLGALVLRQYSALENGIFSVYPGRTPIRSADGSSWRFLCPLPGKMKALSGSPACWCP
jgi:hypothetical protein